MRRYNLKQSGYCQHLLLLQIWFNWLEETHDWCISRQLWWGHVIPAWYIENDDQERFVVARSEEDAYEKAKELVGSDKEITLRREEDVLDTWFR